MAKGRPIGTIYAELDLDASKFTKAQKTILKEAGVVTTGVEKNYKTLGIKSATMFDAMRKQAENAYQGIAHSSRATADDIKRAEEVGDKTASLYFSQSQDVEEVHAKLYKEALEHFLDERETTYHVCTVCGYISDGVLPEECPVCGVSKEKLVGFE